jgi:hypothetical protein
LAELAALGARIVRGKIVFFNFKMNPTYIKTFLAYGESGIARRSGPSEARGLGAIGVMVRSLATNDDDFPHTGLTQYNDSFPKIPAVAISTNDADWLSSAYKRRMMLKVYFRTTSKMLPDEPSFNVVGELKGSELPDKYITVVAIWIVGTLLKAHRTMEPGCVQSIEVLRAFKAGNVRPGIRYER